MPSTESVPEREGEEITVGFVESVNDAGNTVNEYYSKFSIYSQHIAPSTA